jgi:asparagine synthetase B (glutamine-hydrolysing)
VGAGRTKRVLRDGMRGIVPDAILDRHDKLGYQAPMGDWFTGSLRGWCEGKLEQATSTLAGRVAPGLLDRFRRMERIDEWVEGRYIMRMLTLAEGVAQLTGVAADARHYRSDGPDPESQSPRAT